MLRHKRILLETGVNECHRRGLTQGPAIVLASSGREFLFGDRISMLSGRIKSSGASQVITRFAPGERR